MILRRIERFANKAAARMAFEVWSRGDLDRLDEILAPEVVHHDPYDPHGAEGLAAMKASIRRLCAQKRGAAWTCSAFSSKRARGGPSPTRTRRNATPMSKSIAPERHRIGGAIT